MQNLMALSSEAKALRRSNLVFKRGLDPDAVITVLYSELLLTPEEKGRATQKTLTANQQLEVVFDCLEKRVSVDPSVFHKLVQVLRNEPALETVGIKMQALYDEEHKVQTKGVSSVGTPPPKQSGNLEKKPTIPQLISFKTRDGSINIAKEIGTNYSTVGPLLLNDKSGAIMSAIVTQNLLDATNINMEVFRRWVQGQGIGPVTWATLIETLKKGGCSELAGDIEQNPNLND